MIDFFGHSAEQARAANPALFQRLLDRVKPERDLNNRASRRNTWWLFGEPVGKLRNASSGLPRLIVTAETAKHRIFAWQTLPFCPDHKLYAVCSDDALLLGVLSSASHVEWSLAAGGTLEDRPTWTNTTTFLPFPFPAEDTGLTPTLAERIRSLAEQLDAHRKARQAAHESVTLTGLYNVLAKLRSCEPLHAKDKLQHEQGLVSVLRTLHDELDAAVLMAYGWADLTAPLADHTPIHAEARAAAVETLLERLVALNAKRAAEEAAGTVRWLRPDFQQRAAGGTQTAIDTGGATSPKPRPRRPLPRRRSAPGPAACPSRSRPSPKCWPRSRGRWRWPNWRCASPRAGAGASGCR